MLNRSDLPAKWEPVAELIRAQSPGVRELVRYLLVMSLVDAGKARILSAKVSRGRHYLRMETAAGDSFYLLRPPISMATELRLREEIEAMLKEPED